MDYPKPIRLPKNYYLTQFNKSSKIAFISQITPKCQDKEDVTACIEKYEKAYDQVFGNLTTKLEEEDRATFIFDKRLHTGDGLAYKNWVNKPTGYENWS